MANDQDSRVQRLEEVLKVVRAKVASEKRSLLERFVQQYFSQLDPDELAERQPADLYGAALSHWNFARNRDPGSVRLRVFNPSIEEHGWQSTHTIIEIVNDDMPFLVDSVTMEVNRQGYTLHLLIHPLFTARRDKEGHLQSIGPSGKEGSQESLIHVEVDREIDAAKLKDLGSAILHVLADVRASFEDWTQMRLRMESIVKELESPPPFLQGAETD